MEANPESVTAEKAAIARAHGVTRMSMGVQSFHPHHLRFLDRAHTAERAEEAFAVLRASGCENISVDMIFSVPGQTLAEWHADLERVLRLRPDHLSCYNLTFEPGTRLHRDLQQGRIEPNDEETDRAMFLATRERLAAAGFEAYEISNFAGRGGPSRHNDHYWLQGDYVGIGPGASSHRRGVRCTNLKTVESWAGAVLDGTPGAASAETLRPLQRAAEALWLGIRRRDGVDLDLVARRTSCVTRRPGSWSGAAPASCSRPPGCFSPTWSAAICCRSVRSGLVRSDSDERFCRVAIGQKPRLAACTPPMAAPTANSIAYISRPNGLVVTVVRPVVSDVV
jgi:oxygen-independent coproporphyrinogen-3 oxidase